MRFKKRIKLLISIIITLFIILLSFLSSSTKISESFNNKIYDIKVNLAQGIITPDTNIVIAAIDQKSLTYFQKNAVSWPWPRSFYGTLLNYFKEAGAASVIIDIDLSSSEIERLEVDAKLSEYQFAKSISNNGKVVLICSLTDEEDKTIDNVILNKFRIQVKTNHVYNGIFNGVIMPLESYYKSANQLGVVNLVKDKDGIIRNSPILFKYKNMILPQPAFASYIINSHLDSNAIALKLAEFPFNEEGLLRLHWYGPGGSISPFKYYSIHSLIVSAAKYEGGLTPEIPLEVFKNKTIIIGGSAFALLDYKPVPISGDEPFPGMEIHATILSNLNNNDFITELDNTYYFLLIAFFAFISSILFFMFGEKYYVILLNFFVFIVYIVVDYYLFSYKNLSINSFEPIFGIAISAFSTAYSSYLIEGKQKTEIKKIFSRYVNPNVVDELLHDPGKLELGGKEVEATVFFSDIQEFTNIAERLNPKDLLIILNRYFSFTSDIILKQNAFLDKYIGDAIMAIFGIPLSESNHASRACIAALEVQRILETSFNEPNNITPFYTRIGINTGKIIVGNIGTANRSDYTAIGDPVNVASRLESMNSYFGTKILVSESTYEMAKQDFLFREIDKVRVKGKKDPIVVYELITEIINATESQKNLCQLFHEAVIYYKNKDWQEGLNKFTYIANKYEDNTSRIYITRCKDFLIKNPDHPWDGVFNFTFK